MPYDISWYLEPHILRINLSGDVTEAELEDITNTSFGHVQRASNRVHAIIDQHQMESFPMSLKALAKNRIGNQHPNQGMTVIVRHEMHPMLRYLLEVLFQVARWEYRYADTLDEAEAIIRRIDLDIPEPTHPLRQEDISP